MLGLPDARSLVPFLPLTLLFELTTWTTGQRYNIEVHWYWICELVQEGTIEIESCCDPEQTADVLIKALHWEKHLRHIKEMGLAPT